MKYSRNRKPVKRSLQVLSVALLLLGISTLIFLFRHFTNQRDSGTGFGKESTTHISNFYRVINLCQDFYKSGNSDSMSIYSDSLVHYAQKCKIDSFIMAAYKVSGNCSRLQCDYVKAIENYFTALRYSSKKSTLKELTSILYNNVGDNYNKLGFHRVAEKFLRKADSIIGNDETRSLQRSRAYIYNNLGETYVQLFAESPRDTFLLDSAEIWLGRCPNVLVKEKYIEHATRLAAAKVNLMRGDTNQTRLMYAKLIKDCISSKPIDQKHLAAAYYNYSLLELAMSKSDGDIDSAKGHCKKGLFISQKNKYKDDIIDNARQLALIFNKQGKFDSAYRYSGIADDASREVYKYQTNSHLLDIYSNEQISENLEKSDAQRESSERTEYIEYSIIAILVILSVISYFIFSYRHNARPKDMVFLGDLCVLMIFEFMYLLLHPFVGRFSHSVAVMYVVLLIVASLLVPLHHKAEIFVSKLVERNQQRTIKWARSFLKDKEGASNNAESDTK